METVTSFKYLGRVLKEGDENWLAVAGNLKKAGKIWMRMTRMMIQERVDPKVSGLFIQTFVQAVLLLGSDTWFLTPQVEQSLSSF